MRIDSKCRWSALAAVSLACVLAGCAPAAEGSGNDAPEAPAAWSADVECATCHDVEQGSYADAACEASFHAEVACSGCHDDQDTLSQVHEGKTAADNMTKRLKKSQVSNDVCLSCHFGTREALVEATPEVVLADKEGNSRNPHDADGIPEHEGIACGDCHAMHDGKPLADRALDECLGCHHEGVFECGTCHD